MAGAQERQMANQQLAALRSLCEEHGVPLDVVLPMSTDVTAADRLGSTLDRTSAPEVWAALDGLVEQLGVATVV